MSHDLPDHQSRPLVTSEPITERHLISLPDPGAAGLEGLIAQANVQRYEDALAYLTRHCDPESLRLVHGSSKGHEAAFQITLDVDEEEVWEAISAVANHDDLRPGRIAFQVPAGSQAVDDRLDFVTTYGLHRPNLGAVAQKLRAGAAVVIHGLEWQVRSLDRLIATLETIGGRPSSFAAVLLDSGAVYTERDDHQTDILMLPVAKPMKIDSCDGVADGRIIRPGWGVVARARHEMLISASGDRSLIARIELPIADVWADLLVAGANAKFHPLLRADIPTDLNGPMHSYGGTIYRDGSLWRREMEAALGSTARAHAAALARSMLPQRVSPDLGVLSHVRLHHEHPAFVRSPAHGGVMVTTIEDRTCMAVGGRIIHMDTTLAESVAPSLSGRTSEVNGLSETLRQKTPDPLDFAGLLNTLFQVELLEPLP